MFNKVMIIDDNTEDRYIARRMLSTCRFTKGTVEFSDAYSAIKYLRSGLRIDQLPEVIFLDIHMPVMSGFDFLSWYDALDNEIKSRCKVYVLSSSFDEEERDAISKESNVEAFIEKPLTKENLKYIKRDFKVAKH